MDKYIFIVTYLILSLMTFTAHALAEDQNQVLLISSDNADFNHKKHQATFKGNIEIIQGSTHLKAHEIHSKADKNNHLTFAIAYGNKNEQAHYWTLPEKNKEILHAYADKIYFYPDKHLIKLIGNAKITQENNLFKAPIILFDTKNQHVISESNTNEKIKIIIHHEKKS